jgi:uncharacterized phage-associated protein
LFQGEQKAYIGNWMISFTFKPKKFASVVAYLAERRSGITKKELCKLVFFADKEHLLRYGRPITGDRYHALEQGPVPTQGLDALNEKGDPDNVAEVLRYGKLDGWTFCRNDRPPDLKVLSKSDLKVLAEVFDRIGHLPAWRLEELSHMEPAWEQAARNGPMDFELFFEGRDEAAAMKAILLEEHARVA